MKPRQTQSRRLHPGRKLCRKIFSQASAGRGLYKTASKGVKEVPLRSDEGCRQFRGGRDVDGAASPGIAPRLPQRPPLVFVVQLAPVARWGDYTRSLAATNRGALFRSCSPRQLTQCDQPGSRRPDGADRSHRKVTFSVQEHDFVQVLLLRESTQGAKACCRQQRYPKGTRRKCCFFCLGRLAYFRKSDNIHLSLLGLFFYFVASSSYLLGMNDLGHSFTHILRLDSVAFPIGPVKRLTI